MPNAQPITTSHIYPFLLQAVAKEKVWGGRNLVRLFDKALAPDQMIGETWEAWDGCVIENGAHQGMTLASVIEQDLAAILGSTARGNRFPLLYKFIDAQDDLSVQVHPDDAQAQQMENYPFGKTEAWYILHAEPGATLIHGFKETVDPARVTQMLADNRLQDLLAHVPVHSGDVVFVPAGTVHAIGRGIVLAEIQENSDITYRLYDWGRVGKGRDLHIDQSMRVAELQSIGDHKIPRLTIKHAEFDQHYLVACRYFSLELYDARAAIRNLITDDRFQIISVLQGAAEIVTAQSRIAIKRGQTCLLPAQLGAFEIVPASEPCQFLRAYIPKLATDVIAPLRQAGYSAGGILNLGGNLYRHNDLLPFLSSR